MTPRRLVGLAAGTVITALLVTAAVVWPGLDARETSRVDTTVWALQTADGRRYARVNTALGELDTVRQVADPTAVVQTGDGVFLFTGGYAKVTRVDPALPVDLDDEALRASPATPAGTVAVATAGDHVAYLTDTATVWAGRLGGDLAAVALFPDPATGVDAVAVEEDGTLFAYSRAAAAVAVYDLAAGSVRRRDATPADLPEAITLTAAGATWALVDAAAGEVWLRDRADPVTAGTTGAAVVAAASVDAHAVLLADQTQLIAVDAVSGDVSVAVGDGVGVLGTPAPPLVRDGVTYAAWLPEGGGGGTLWTSTGATAPLDYGTASLGDERRPQFVAGPDAVILNETRTGWVWTAPEGRLVASSQDWTLDETVSAQTPQSDQQLEVQLDPKPPVAEPDAFGVRAGALVTLPVLLNDHDPNEDVLAIDPASVTGLDPGFGAVTLTDDRQRLAVRVAPDATGSATFAYAVSDGTTEGGLLSAPATVTLTVLPDDVQSAPQWCGVTGCLATWPAPEVARGGTVSVPVLPGWVDPEGDPLVLLSATDLSGVGSVAATPDGQVVYQHADDGSGRDELVQIEVAVADTRGASTTKTLTIRITPQPALALQSFAVVDVAGTGRTVEVMPHVTGTMGTVTVDSARPLDGAPLTATPVAGAAAFDLRGDVPGTFRVAVVVTDGKSTAEGTVRVTLLAPDAPADLTTSPVVAFVRPQRDATLDVFAAVSNPTRRVLLLSDVTPRAAEGATLSVDVVAQSSLRVSGTTATGEAGVLGTVRYLVGDGTEDSGSQVTGEATVYLLPPAPALAPIAVDDAVVVRAGAQIDIPVLDGDIAPGGGRPVLDPAQVVSSSPDALAFASGDVLRYLAPTEPGRYTVDYTVSTVGAPTLADTATVHIQVLSDEANRDPVPRTLEGRVLSGQTTVIPFDGFGMDPDGDVVTLDRIVTQPASGVAAIGADGTSIVYTSVAGQRGQVSFRYRVTDGRGGTGEATVRIGVLDAQADPRPVTFTDEVQVQAGRDALVRVQPLANDVDPAGAGLRLTAVRPDLVETFDGGEPNPEYARVAALLRGFDDTTVEIAAGEQIGTMSFLYDVESEAGSTARGLIVVTVVRDAVPDYPIVADTVLTVENRDEFPRGVDVLDGTARWSGGDVGALQVLLWGSPTDVALVGSRISGDLPATTRIIPFAVTGEGASGTVTTYAFLRVPGDDDLVLTLRAGARASEVDELDAVQIDVTSLVAIPRAARLELGDAVAASGARPAATCTRTSAATVRYDAGAGAPFTDACVVPVRLIGQEEWTYLSLPIVVRARDPQPVLSAAALTVGPGETATFDLRRMTTWELQRPAWDTIGYAVTFTGTAFEVVQVGAVLTITGADRAVPGREEAVTVAVTTSPGVAPARLSLRVGAAPSTLPQGGAVTQQCSQASGSGCVLTVVGAPGEVNPLPRTPLEVVEVRATGACVGVRFQVASASTVTASWDADAPGATCTAAVTLQDAQGRRTAGTRDAALLLDLQGYPRAPASIAQTSFGDGTLTLRVDPGAARAAYPALSGFVVRWQGQIVARCAADGVCPAIPAPNGEQRTYTATAVNAVGESRSGVTVLAWAYAAPGAVSGVSVLPVVTADGQGGVVSLAISGLDPAQAAGVEVTSPAGESVRVALRPGQTTLEIPSYRVGANSSSPITVTPFSRFSVPPGLGGGGGTAAPGVTVWGNGVGAPLSPVLQLDAVSTPGGTSTVTATGSASSGGDGSTLRSGIVPAGQTCTATAGGATATFAGLPDGVEYTYVLCVESWIGTTRYGRVETTAVVRAVQSVAAPTGYTFVVDATPTVAAGRADWVVRAAPTSPETAPRRNIVEVQGLPSTVFGRDPGIRVRYVHDTWGTTSDWAAVVPAAGGAPYQVQASWSVSSCVGGGALALAATSTDAAATTAFDDTAAVFRDASGAVLEYAPGSGSVPSGAVSVSGLRVTVTWPAAWSLSAATATFGGTCQP